MGDEQHWIELLAWTSLSSIGVDTVSFWALHETLLLRPHPFSPADKTALPREFRRSCGRRK
jgi:hypothetical protein